MIDPSAILEDIRRRYSVAGLPAYVRRFRKRPARACTDPGEPWERLSCRTLDGWRFTAPHIRRGDRVAILVHGLHGDLARMVALSEMFARKGISAILAPVRGHDGHPCGKTTGGPEEAFDAAAVVDAAIEAGYPPGDILVYGSSMGAAVAVKTACIFTQTPLGGVIAHACYTDFFGAARQKLGPFRTRMLKALLPSAPRRSLEDFRPADYARACPGRTPMVFLSGTRDSVCPPEMGSALADASARGLFMALGGAGHPRWEHPELQNSWQLEKALGLAMDWMDGNMTVEGTLFIDEECSFRNVPRLRKGISRSGKAR